MRVPTYNVYSKKTGKYLGKRSVHSTLDKGTITYYIIWKNRKISFKPIAGEERKVYI